MTVDDGKKFVKHFTDKTREFRNFDEGYFERKL